MNPFIQGLIAGYGIAIPVGAIAILILDSSMRRGFPHGFAAGAGAATADLVYAVIACTGGVLLAPHLIAVAPELRLVSTAVLLFIGSRGLLALIRARQSSGPGTIEHSGLTTTFWTFLGLTILNPLTIAYFASLVIGSNSSLTGSSSLLLFVAGAALASFSWQSLLAAIGAVARRSLPPSFRTVTAAVGNLVVIGIGIAIFTGTF
jgi:arginine exporter protein ArgO